MGRSSRRREDLPGRDLFAEAGVYTAHHRGFGFAIPWRDQGSRTCSSPADDAGAAPWTAITVQVAVGGAEAANAGPRGTVIKVSGAGQRTGSSAPIRRAKRLISASSSRIIPGSAVDIFVPQGKDMGAVTGHKVGGHASPPTGTGEKKSGGAAWPRVLGHVNDPGVDILSIVRAYGLPEVLSGGGHGGVRAPCPGRSVRRKPRIEELKGRKSICEACPPSPSTARTPRIWTTRMTHFRENARAAGWSTVWASTSPTWPIMLDGGEPSGHRGAYRRGTSVYLVDRVIPMLPPPALPERHLLLERRRRAGLALSCLMEIDENGNIIWVTRSVETLGCRWTGA